MTAHTTLEGLVERLALHTDSAFVSFITNGEGDRLVGVQTRNGPGDENLLREDYLTDGTNVVLLSPVVEGCLEVGRAALVKLRHPPKLYADAILGRDPPYVQMRALESLGLGHWTGGQLDRWSWNRAAVYALDDTIARAIYDELGKTE